MDWYYNCLLYELYCLILKFGEYRMSKNENRGKRDVKQPNMHMEEKHA